MIFIFSKLIKPYPPYDGSGVPIITTSVIVISSDDQLIKTNKKLVKSWGATPFICKFSIGQLNIPFLYILDH